MEHENNFANEFHHRKKYSFLKYHQLHIHIMDIFVTIILVFILKENLIWQSILQKSLQRKRVWFIQHFFFVFQDDVVVAVLVYSYAMSYMMECMNVIVQRDMNWIKMDIAVKVRNFLFFGIFINYLCDFYLWWVKCLRVL